MHLLKWLLLMVKICSVLKAVVVSVLYYYINPILDSLSKDGSLLTVNREIIRTKINTEAIKVKEQI